MKSNRKAIEGRSSAPCSPSSTPETSKAWDDVSRTPDGMYDSSVNIREYAAAMLNHSRKMERERNEARCELREMVVAVSLSSFLPGDAYEWLRSHPENAATHAPGANDKPLK